MEILELTANMRTSAGNSPSRALRREGNIPAVLYGPGTESVMLSISSLDLEHALKKAAVSQIIFNMAVQNAQTGSRTAMIKELQIHPMSRKFLHVDFYEISKDRKITVNVPVVAKGKAKGIEEGGMLQIIEREIEVLCLPFDVPESIQIDISDLGIGDSIHVKDLKVAENVEIPADTNYTILTILSTKSDEKAPGEESGAEGSPAAVGK
ncbi:MAG: 50S ribosomal protein L25/general stress protein Ctc [Deltaproteobacteria bacterium]|nr:50S ribosomal protein L25/general stress protein Ctc [Deltaproteobacteria bacterium]